MSPMSAFFVNTTPSKGARIIVYSTATSAAETAAWADFTAARADSTAARAFWYRASDVS